MAIKNSHTNTRVQTTFLSVLISLAVLVNGIKPHNSPMARSRQQLQGNEVDMEMLKEMSKETDTVEFFKKFIGNVKVKEEKDGTAYLTDKDGKPMLGEDNRNIVIYKPRSKEKASSEGLERAGLTGITDNAKCSPRTTPFHVDFPHKKPNFFYYPPCVDLMRCTGCCETQQLLNCVSSKTRDVKVRTYELQIVFVDGASDPKNLDFVGHRNITMVEDLACVCECAVLPYHCTSYQSYSKKTCSCFCPVNTDANKQKCEDELPRTGNGWDYRLCSCRCPHVSCPRGQYFDDYDCECLRDSYARSIRLRRDVFNTTNIGRRYDPDALINYF